MCFSESIILTSLPLEFYPALAQWKARRCCVICSRINPGLTVASPRHSCIPLVAYGPSAESLCLTCTLWRCQQALLRIIIRNSRVTVACMSAVRVLLRPLIFTLGTLQPLHGDSQEKLTADLISRNNAPFNALSKHLLRDFLGGPVAKTPHSQLRGPRFNS